MDERMIPLDKIDFNPFQARTSFDEDRLNELVASMEANGQLVAVGVYQHKDRYIVYDGDRRVKAARSLGWSDIRAEIHGILETLDGFDSAVLEMREKADQANEQRDDITPMDRARSRAKLFEDGKKAGRYSSQAAFAKYLGTNERSISQQLGAVRDELEYFGEVLPHGGESRPDTVLVYRESAGLRSHPEIRKKFIEAVAAKDIPNSPESYYNIGQAIKAAPESADAILGIAKSGSMMPHQIRDTVAATTGMEPEMRTKILKMRAAEEIKSKELEDLVEIIKDNPTLADYALDLKRRGTDIHDVRRSVQVTAARPDSEKRQIVESMIIFREDPGAFKMEVAPPLPEETKAALSEMVHVKPDRKAALDNLTGHMGIVMNEDTMYCPKCGPGGRLVWSCCGLTVTEANELAKKKWSR